MSDPLEDFLKTYQPTPPKASKEPPAQRDPIFDEIDALDAALAKQEEAQKANAARTLPLSPERQAKLDQRIAETSLPLPGGFRTLAESFGESNRAVGQNLADKTLGGVPGQIMRDTPATPEEIAVADSAGLFGIPGIVQRLRGTYGAAVQPIPETGKKERADTPGQKVANVLPTEDTLSNIPAAAIDMAATGNAFGRAGQAAGQAPASLARSLGASEAQTVARPGLQAAFDMAATGGLYSGADTAVRGGGPQEVLASMPEGAAAALAMGQLPRAAQSIEGMLRGRVAANDLRPVKQMSKKGSLDKSLSQFGDGDPEEGARQMAKFVTDEDLGPILRQKGSRATSLLEAKKNDVWRTDLEPIYRYAKLADPEASVSINDIARSLRGQVKVRGANEDALVEKAIAELKNRVERVSDKGEMPLDTLLENARDFQSAGHAGVVNYDAPPASKVAMRKVGHTLRQMVNEKVAEIYRRNPEAAYQLFTGEQPTPMGMTYRDQPSTPTNVRADQYPNAWARRYENFQQFAEDIPRLLQEGNQRYSNYAKLEPIVTEASKLKAGEKKHGLISMLGHGISGGAASLLGYSVGGVHGAVAVPLALEAARYANPYATRAARATAGFFGGPTVPPTLQQQFATQSPYGPIRYTAPGGSQLAGALTLKPLEDRRD